METHRAERAESREQSEGRREKDRGGGEREANQREHVLCVTAQGKRMEKTAVHPTAMFYHTMFHRLDLVRTASKCCNNMGHTSCRTISERERGRDTQRETKRRETL